MPRDISSSSSEDEADRPTGNTALRQKGSGGGVSSPASTVQKPTRYQCPADFVSFRHKPCSSTLAESLKNNKNELWLIKAPASFSPECFSGVKVPLSGLQTLKVPAAAGGVNTGSGQQIYSVLASAHGASELCLLTGDEESSGGVVFGPTFSGLLNVCESYGDSSDNRAPQVIPAAPAPSIPPGLKQRFHPFGSKTPALTRAAEAETDGAAVGPSSATPHSLLGKRLMGETKQQEEEEEEEGRKKKKKKEKRIKTEQGEESTEEVRVKEEPVTEIQDRAMTEEGDISEGKRKKKKKKKDREREEVEDCVKVEEEVTVKREPTDTLYGDVAEGSAKKKKKKKKSKTDDD